MNTKRYILLAAATALILLHAGITLADSGRVEPAEPDDFTAEDIFLAAQDEDHWYSSGLEVVYVDGERHFLTLWNTSANWPSYPAPNANSITLSLYDSDGNLIQDLATYTDPLNTDGDSGNDVTMYPQCVKLDPSGSTVWVSYTSNDSSGNWNVSDYFCTVSWDNTLASYPTTMVREAFETPGNWEMEWSTDHQSGGLGGNRFVSALASGGHQGIYLYQSNGLQQVIDVGGSSSGFAFDNSGNLWLADVNYSDPKIYMWTADQIRTAVNGYSLLDLTDATVSFSTPNGGLGNDVERDGSGDLFFTLNGGTTYYGDLAIVENSGSEPWPDSAIVIASTLDYYDWQRSLAYDGSGSLVAGYGSLFLDMDQASQGSTTPTIVEISSTATPTAVPAVSPLALLLVTMALIGTGVFHIGSRAMDSAS
jgi:hypothetical protein